MASKTLFKSLNSKLIVIAAVVISIIGVLLLFNALSIQALLVLGNFGAVGALVLWERQRRNDALNSSTNYSNDERWTRAKMDLEKIENKLGKTKDPTKKRALIRQKDYLQNELRRLEWSIREANMNSMYNAEKGGLRGPGPSKSDENDKNDPGPNSAPKNWWNLDPSDKLGAKAAIRKRAELEIEDKDRQTLLKALDNAEAIIGAEPVASLPNALQPIANHCKAHYNLIKKRGKLNSSILGDYWVAWSLVLYVQNRLPFDSTIIKYASKDFAYRANKFMRSVDAVRYSKTDSIPYIRSNTLAGIASDKRFEGSGKLETEK